MGEWTEVDPFDLPEWLGVDQVTWASSAGLRGGLIAGVLRSERDGTEEPCDLLAVDRVHPTPIVSEEIRIRVHQTWRIGQVLLLSPPGADRPGRLAIASPGVSLSPEQVLEMLARFAASVGASPERYAVRMPVRHDRY